MAGSTGNVATNTFCMFPSSRILDSCATVDPLYIYIGEIQATTSVRGN